VCTLRLKLTYHSPRLIHAYRKSATAQYPDFVEEISDTLRRVKANKSILSREFNVQVRSDVGVQKRVAGQHGHANINDNGKFILLLCCNNATCIVTHFSNTEICIRTPVANIRLGSSH